MLLCARPWLVRLETLPALSLRLLSWMGTQQLENHRSCAETALALGESIRDPDTLLLKHLALGGLFSSSVK